MKFPKFKWPSDEIKVFGLFGYPLGHSLSAEMHNAAFRAVGMPAIYLPFERNPKQFLKLVRSKRRMILDGFNLTIPHKESILPYLNKIDPAAKFIGAVNTVKRSGNQWAGYNTDAFGFSEGLREVKFQARGKKAVILGAGGGARAAIVALLKSGISEVVIVNRTLMHGKNLAIEFQRKFPNATLRSAPENCLKGELENTNLLVNATPIGIRQNDRSIVSRSQFPKKRILVYDLLYHFKETSLLKLASRLGNRIKNGETMLLMQGAKAFEIWTGRKAPVKVMRKALQNAIRAV